MAEHHRQGAVDVVRLTDRLNAEQASDLAPLVEKLASQGRGRLVFDLRDVSLIDGEGLEFALDVRDRCMRLGGALRLAGANPLCREILAVTGVDQEIEVLSDAVVAAGSFAR